MSDRVLFNRTKDTPTGIGDYVGFTGHERHAVHQTHFGGYSEEYQSNYDRIFRKEVKDDTRKNQETA